jgi:hypothetical protein
MMSHDDLRSIRRRIAGRHALSVYLAADTHDPAQRAAWRLRLNELLEKARSGAKPDTIDALNAAIEKLLAELGDVTGFLPGRSWAAFVTADEVVWRGPLEASARGVVEWRAGPTLAPALRSIKESRPLTLTLVDSRRARLFRYQHGELTETADIRADGYLGDLSDTNVSKRGTVATGVRGKTATDAARRALHNEMDRMLDDVASRITELAGTDAEVVFGGSTEAAAALAHRLEPLGDRAFHSDGLFLAMAIPAALEATRTAATQLTANRHAAAMERIFESGVPAGRAATGFEGARTAAANGQVDTLYVSRRYAAEHADELEELIGLVLDAGGTVEELGIDLSERLDDLAGGVAARLRYVRRPAASLTGSD